MTAVLAVSAVGVAGSLGAASAGESDPREQLEDNVERQAELAEQLDTLTSTASELESALAAIAANLEMKEAEVRATQQALATATVEAEAARLAHDEKIVELARLQARLDEMVVDAFVHPPSLSALDALVSSNDPSEAMTKEVLRGTKVDWDVSVIEQVTAVKEELAELEEETAALEAEAEALRDEAVAELAALEAARQEHEIFAAAVQQRIDADYAEALEIADQNSELAKELAEDAERMAVAIVGGEDRSSIPLVEVNGIWVHEVIAPQLGVMLDDAAFAGIELGGGGYRTTAQQIELRKAHCGEEAVFTAPAGSCSPPTAKPGTSMHELGLAIDFTVDGRTIGTQEHPAFVWLAEHAGDYGFKNLESEPWHWSVTGQ